MKGRASAPGAGTVLNALATGTGSAFAIDLETTADVELDESPGVHGSIEGERQEDTSLIERCVALTLEQYGDAEFIGGTVETASEIPMAAGLKSSSAAANATVRATLGALGKDQQVDALDATRLGVEAARDVGVTVTGAFDDASASMLGGLTITDNENDELLAQDTWDRAVAIYTPPERAYSAEADVDRCRRIGAVANVVASLAKEGSYADAMTINGFAFAATLEFSPEPMLAALPAADGVSLSGTGPSTVAVGTDEGIDAVMRAWSDRPGNVIRTRTQSTGARLI